MTLRNQEQTTAPLRKEEQTTALRKQERTAATLAIVIFVGVLIAVGWILTVPLWSSQ